MQNSSDAGSSSAAHTEVRRELPLHIDQAVEPVPLPDEIKLAALQALNLPDAILQRDLSSISKKLADLEKTYKLITYDTRDDVGPARFEAFGAFIRKSNKSTVPTIALSKTIFQILGQLKTNARQKKIINITPEQNDSLYNYLRTTILQVKSFQEDLLGQLEGIAKAHCFLHSKDNVKITGRGEIVWSRRVSSPSSRNVGQQSPSGSLHRSSSVASDIDSLGGFRLTTHQENSIAAIPFPKDLNERVWKKAQIPSGHHNTGISELLRKLEGGYKADIDYPYEYEDDDTSGVMFQKVISDINRYLSPTIIRLTLLSETLTALERKTDCAKIKFPDHNFVATIQSMKREKNDFKSRLFSKIKAIVEIHIGCHPGDSARIRVDDKTGQTEWKKP